MKPKRIVDGFAVAARERKGQFMSINPPKGWSRPEPQQGMVRGVGTPRTWTLLEHGVLGIRDALIVASMPLLLEGKAVQDECLDGLVDEVSVRDRGRLHLGACVAAGLTRTTDLAGAVGL